MVGGEWSGTFWAAFAQKPLANGTVTTQKNCTVVKLFNDGATEMQFLI